MQDEWEGFEHVDETRMMEDVDTTVDMELLTEVAEVISKLPEDKKFLRKIKETGGPASYHVL